MLQTKSVPTCATLELTCATLNLTCTTLNLTWTNHNLLCGTHNIPCTTDNFLCRIYHISYTIGILRLGVKKIHFLLIVCANVPNIVRDYCKLCMSYEHWNKFSTNIVDKGSGNDNNQEDAPTHNDDHYSSEDGNWNDLIADVDKNRDDGLNCLAYAIFYKNGDPHVNNEYIDNPDKELDFIYYQEHFPAGNNWINQHVVVLTEFDIRRTNTGLPSIDETWVRRIFYDKASLADVLDR